MTIETAPTSGFHGRLFALVAPIYAKLWKPVILTLLSGGGFQKELRDILALRRPAADERIVDVGCGPGNFTIAFARLAPGGFVTGVDLALPMLTAARRRAEEAGMANIALAQGDAQRLPIRRDSVSLVSCCGTLHLLPKPELALAEIAAVLRPGGSLVGMTFVKGEGWAQRLLEQVFNRVLHFRFFPLARVEQMLAEAGLTLEARTRARLILLFHARKPG